MSKWKRGVIITVIITGLAGLTYLLFPPLSPLSPLGISVSLPDSSADIDSEYVILGFAPYWNMKKLSPESLESITHFAYFALHLNSDGSIYTHVNRREQDPGYTNYQRLLKEKPTGKPIILTYMPESQKALESIITIARNRTQAVTTIVSTVRDSGAVGVNVDFEPLGDTNSYRDEFTAFMKELHTRASKENMQISVSVYPSAASRARIWDLAALSSLVDYVVVMAYDYTLPGDDKTGPNSPLRGAGTLFKHDIVTNLAEITKLVPSEKIILGIPFYGYEWSTQDTAKYTPTSKRGAVASLERINEMVAENTLELLWDRNSLTPYAIRREDGEVISQIYFENENSIKLKLDLVRQAKLGGIAIWALGYEGSNPSLWSTIKNGLSAK